MAGIRPNKVGDAIKVAVADYLVRNLANLTPGFITTSKVEMAPDIKTAKIFFSIYGDENAVKSTMRIIISHRKKIRFHIGQNVPLKYVPEVLFILDETLLEAEKINKLLREII